MGHAAFAAGCWGLGPCHLSVQSGTPADGAVFPTVRMGLPHLETLPKISPRDLFHDDFRPDNVTVRGSRQLKPCLSHMMP